MMPAPERKRYSRHHMACVIIICVLKQSLTLAEIQRILPQEMTEAVYGAVILNTVTSEAEYYTLESSVDDRWVIGHKTTSCHSNLGSLDSADQDKFVAWVMERAGYKLLQ
jgi:hypothetical protein